MRENNSLFEDVNLICYHIETCSFAPYTAEKTPGALAAGEPQDGSETN